MNDKGRIRIDYQSAQPIATSEAIKDSWLLKTLAVGTSLDIEVVRKLNELPCPTVKSYWKSKGLYSGVGYISAPELPQYDAEFMRKLPDFVPPAKGRFSVDVASPHEFGQSTAHMPRNPKLYKPPLLIVPQAPGASSSSAKSYLLYHPVVFSQSFYGFSAHGLSDASPVCLLHLLTHSDLFSYRVLMTSSRMAAERRTFIKMDIENFPFPADLLTEELRRRAIELSTQLETASSKPRDAINDFIFDLYGLGEYDRQVVKDTLEVAAPFKEARDRANKTPAKSDRNAFYAAIHQFLAPSFGITNETVSIEEVEIKKKGTSPWHFFSVSSTSVSATLTPTAQKHLICRITEEADKTGCSRVHRS